MWDSTQGHFVVRVLVPCIKPTQLTNPSKFLRRKPQGTVGCVNHRHRHIHTHTHTDKNTKISTPTSTSHTLNPQLLGLSAEDSSCKFEGAHHRNFRGTLSGHKAEALRRAYDSGLQTEGAAEGSTWLESHDLGCSKTLQR